jgi:hypothetical protein
VGFDDAMATSVKTLNASVSRHMSCPRLIDARTNLLIALFDIAKRTRYHNVEATCFGTGYLSPWLIASAAE